MRDLLVLPRTKTLIIWWFGGWFVKNWNSCILRIWVRREGNPSPTFLVQTTLGRNPKTLLMRRTSPPSRLPSLYRSAPGRNRVVGSVSCWRKKRRRRRSLSRRLLCGGRSRAVRKGVPSEGSGRRGEGYTPSLSRVYSHLDPGKPFFHCILVFVVMTVNSGEQKVPTWVFVAD